VIYKPLLRQIAILFVGCAPAFGADFFVDPRDGHDYPTVAIGSLVWMAANLAYPTPNSWCFDDQSDNCESDGRLFSWAAAMAACPTGWRLATDGDWADLETALGMDPAQVFAQGPRGTNEGALLPLGGRSGFNAPICGYRRPDGSYARRGERAAFWTASEHSHENAWHRDIRNSVGTVYRSPVTKTYALSIRCVRERDLNY
jgi:uncharacterized protein (TIGR02145 family)